jgi:hypothetical protein
MKVTINQGQGQRTRVIIRHSLPAMNLALSPQDALSLYQELHAQHSAIEELARNFWECAECGQEHSITVKKCPTLVR